MSKISASLSDMRTGHSSRSRGYGRLSERKHASFTTLSEQIGGVCVGVGDAGRGSTGKPYSTPLRSGLPCVHDYNRIVGC